MWEREPDLIRAVALWMMEEREGSSRRRRFQSIHHKRVSHRIYLAHRNHGNLSERRKKAHTSFSNVCGLTCFPRPVRKTCLFTAIPAFLSTKAFKESRLLIREPSTVTLSPECPMKITSDMPLRAAFSSSLLPATSISSSKWIHWPAYLCLSKSCPKTVDRQIDCYLSPSQSKQNQSTRVLPPKKDPRISFTPGRIPQEQMNNNEKKNAKWYRMDCVMGSNQVPTKQE